MKKEALKAVAVVGLVLALAFVSAVATADTSRPNSLRAKISFGFMVGDKTLPAGVYAIRQITDEGNAILVQNIQNNAGVVRLTSLKKAAASESRAKLVFHRYGQRYFLAEVWDGSPNGRALSKSSAEKAVEQELAKNNEQVEIVTVFVNAE